MRLSNVLGLIVCGALLGAPGVAQAQDRANPGQQREDPQTQQRQQPNEAQPRQQPNETPREGAQARGQQSTAQVEFGDLRDNPDQYQGRTVSFEADVDAVLGPNMVRLSSTSFWDWFGGDILAYAPDALGIAVSDRDRVTITGTAEQFDEARVRQHLAWVDPEEDVDDAVRERAVIRITQITTDDGRQALVERGGAQTASAGQGRAVGTTGAQAGQADRDRQATGAAGRDTDRDVAATTGRMTEPISELEAAFDARRRDVGRQVNLQQVQIERMLGDRFFLAQHDGEHILVTLPEGQSVKTGQSVTLQGVLMQMPDSVRRMPGVSEDDLENVRDNDVYILATNVGAGAATGQQPRQPQAEPGAQQQPRQQPGQPGQPQGQQPRQPAQPQGQGAPQR